MGPGLAIMVSLLRFIAEEAPHLVSDLQTVITVWAEREMPGALPTLRNALRIPSRSTLVERLSRAMASERPPSP